MEQADLAVLDQFADYVLDKDIVDGAIMDAIAELRPAADAVSAARAGLEGEIRKLEGEQGRLVKSIALAGGVAALTSALKDREGRLTHLRRELAAVTGAREIACFDPRRIEMDLRKKIDEWRGLLRRQTPIARQMLTKLINGRLVFAPDVEQRCYTFTGTATLGNLLKGLVLPNEPALPLVIRPQRDSNQS